MFLVYCPYAILAQSVEHSHGKGEVAGSIPADGSCMPPLYLTKTDYIHYLCCPKSLWLLKHKPEAYVREEFSEFLQKITREGYEIEKYAQALYPGSISLPAGVSAVEKTRAALTEEIPVLFQPTFRTDNGLFIRVDILKRLPDGTYALYEVKSSAKIKKDAKHNHVKDVCFQKIALERSGLSVSAMYIIHVNPDYVRSEEIDPRALLRVVDVTDAVRALEDETAVEIGNALALLSSDRIDEEGCGCCRKTRSNHCDSFAYFNGSLPACSVWELGNIRKKRLCSLLERGILTIADVPDDTELSDFQFRQVRSAVEGRPIINDTRIGEMLGALVFPLYFFDYETAMNAVPRVIGTRPWQQIPFQFSLHILHEDNRLDHTEYVSDSLDGAGGVVRALLDAVGPTGSFVSWHASFEKLRNREMGDFYPAYRDALEDINERMFDLEDIFKEAYADSSFHGSTSIKKVLPVLCPRLSYAGLAVHDGTQAMEQWFAMIDSNDAAERGRIRGDLLEYCELDTFAMVELYRVLAGLLR